MTSLIVAGLVVLASLITQLAAATLVPATASAAPTTRLFAYVTNGSDNTVTPIDLATNTPGTPIPVGSIPEGIAVTPNGTTAYVTNFFGNSVTPIDLTTNTPGPGIPVGNRPVAVAFTPDGTTAYVANSNDGTVTPITVATNTAGTAIFVGGFPSGIAVTPDGTTAYVTAVPELDGARRLRGADGGGEGFLGARRGRGGRGDRQGGGGGRRVNRVGDRG